MRVEKQGPKGGGGHYMGGFRNLFDWNAKSRKKLFSKSDLVEQLKQKERNDEDMPMTPFHTTNDYNYASSVTDEDCYIVKAPGVVARLMGLDSLPHPNPHDSYSNPSSDSQSLRDSSLPYIRKKLELERKDHETPNDPMPQKSIIAKFQTETLPPRSAKPIPVTQNKLLSPIKSPGFVSSSNPACIMEAASRIPLTASSLSSSSSVRSKVNSQRQKTENSARKPPKISRTEPNVVKNLKGCSKPKPFRILEDDGSSKKSMSLALQAKVNVQKREGLRLFGAETVKKPPADRTSSSTVLKQNNQKQNCLVERGKSASKSSVKRSSQIATNRREHCMEDDKNGTDIVSFTFSRSMPRPVTSKTESLAESRNCNSSKSDLESSLSYNVLKTDFLSTLLDQKLRELSGYSPSDSQDSSSIFHDKANDPQGAEVTSECLGNNYEYRKFVNGQNPIPITGGKIMDDKSTFRYLNKMYDSQTFSVSCCKQEQAETPSMERERGYVKEILSDIESMFDDFTVGRTQKIVNPQLFDHLEAKRPNLDEDKAQKLRRSLMFDFVCESMGSRCRVWAQGLVAVTRKDWLAHEVYKEISKCEEMNGFTRDELLDKDMSCDQYRKWLDFDVEALELGVEIEKRILSSLIDEAVGDIFVL